MYLTNFDEFAERSTQLFLKSPLKTRYTFKYRHADHALVLKVTDDVVCLKYATSEAADMKNFEKFNNLFMKLMASKHLDHETLQEAARETAAADASSTPARKGGDEAGPKKKKNRE